MAARGLAQCTLRLPYSSSPRAARKTCLAPRAFQNAARGLNGHALGLYNGVRPRTLRRLPRSVLYCALHAGSRAQAQGMSDTDHGQEPHIAEEKSTQLVGGTDTPWDPAEMRRIMTRLMRRVPQPVTIVTAININANPEGGRDAWRGATISSFNTVTFDPDPVVSFNIKKLSSTFDAIQSSGRFWVHFLRTTPSSTRLADKFTKGHSPELFRGVHVVHESKDEEREARTVRDPRIGSFEIKTARGWAFRNRQIAFVLDCVYLRNKNVEIGDHVVLFGTVTGVRSSKSPNLRDSSTAAGEPCLVYADQGYHKVQHLETTAITNLVRKTTIPAIRAIKSENLVRRTNSIRSGGRLSN